MNELTPEEVRDVVFDHAPMFHRGYDETQVDEFLDRVEAAMIALHRSVGAKQQELDDIAMRSTDPHGPPTGGHEHRMVGDQIIAEARRRADQIVDSARGAAQRAIEEARSEAFRLVANASRTIVGAGATGRLPNERERELAAAVAEASNRIGQIRDALTAETTHLYQLAEQIDLDAG